MYFRSSSDILAGRTKSVQIDIAILDNIYYLLFYLPAKSNIILFGRYFSPPIAVMLVK